jgi:dTDP-3-amino-3,4,6-trideoxy-alpha-D-glucose transaminase
MILLNDFKREYADIGIRLMSQVDSVLASGNYILGESVCRFEANLAEAFKCGWAVGTANGMDAIEISLRTLGLTAGEKVLTTPLTAFATTLAIYRAGGVPVFVDVDPQGNVDIDLAEAVLKQDTSIKYMLPVHLYGIPLNLIRLKQLKKAYGLLMVEDCAQAIEASYHSQLVGSVGDLAAISFYPTKNLGAFGDAGAILGNKASFRKLAQAYRNYGQSTRYVHNVAGLNSRLDELQASILDFILSQRLETYTGRRREIAEYYLAHIQNEKVTLPVIEIGSKPVWHLFPVLVEGDRDKFITHCRDHGVQTGIHYPILVPDQKAMTNIEHQVFGSLPNASRFAIHEVSIPIHPYMTDKEVKKVVQVIQAYT